MAKGQKRPTKEAKKPKATEKKADGPKYLRPTELGQSRLGAQKPDKKS